MAVTVSNDLSVNVSEDENVKKLIDKQQVLRDSIRKGEPKSMGISQVMLGFLIISYAMPLLSVEFSQTIKYAVPWWSGITFILAGAFALLMEKRNSIKLVLICMIITIFAAFISIIALIFYIMDFLNNPVNKCTGSSSQSCEIMRQILIFNESMTTFLVFLNVVQTAVSSIFSFILYKERKRFISYTLVN